LLLFCGGGAPNPGGWKAAVEGKKEGESACVRDRDWVEDREEKRKDEKNKDRKRAKTKPKPKIIAFRRKEGEVEVRNKERTK
jgi:hypothetical protein